MVKPGLTFPANNVVIHVLSITSYTFIVKKID